jgi:hypothetical protein
MTVTVTATKIDSSNESGKNFITWAWPASTTIIYDSPVFLFKRQFCFMKSFYRHFILSNINTG